MADRTGPIGGRSLALGPALRSRRRAAHLSQEALAELAGVSTRTISDLERGIQTSPRRGTLEAIAQALETAAAAAPRFTVVREPAGSDLGLPSLLRSRPGQQPFVGRHDARAAFERLWADARHGARGAVLFAGEPGIGKSRLLAELSAGVATENAVVLAGRCDESMAIPYGAIAQALHAPLAGDGWDVIAEALGDEASLLALVAPEAAGRVAVPATDDDRDLKRTRMLNVIEQTVALIGGDSPVVLVVDDLHAADTATLGAIHRLVLSERTEPFLLLGAYRDTDVDAGHPLLEWLHEFRRHRLVGRFELPPLSPEDVHELVECSMHVRPDRDVIDAIARHTGGNAFFVEEVLAYASEHHGNLGDSITHVPASARQTIDLRLRRLSPDARAVLEQAALIGTAFDAALLRRLGSRSVAASIDEAASAGFIDASESELSFRHALVRAALVDDLARRDEAAAIHWRIGDALEAAHVADLEPYVAEIAHHLRHGAPAGDPTKAVRYLERAGAQAFAALAFDEAVDALGAAVELCRDDAAGDRDRMRILELLAEVHFWRDDPDAMRSTALASAELARRSGSPDDLARTAAVAARWNRGGVLDGAMLELLDEALDRLEPVDSAARSRLLGMRAYVLQGAARGFETRSLAVHAEAMARRCGDDDALALALVVRTYTEAGSPDVAALQDVALELEQVAARVPRSDHRRQFRSFALGALLQAQLASGDRRRSTSTRAELGAIADAMRAPFLRSQLMYLDAALALAEGRIDAAAEISTKALHSWNLRPDALRVYAAQTIAIAMERGDYEGVIAHLEAFVAGDMTSIVFLGRAVMTTALAEARCTGEALTRFGELSRNGFEALNDDHFRPQSLRWLCEAAATLGAADAADSLLQLVSPYSGTFLIAPHATAIECAADRCIAQMHAMLDNAECAARHYERAAALEHEAGFAGLETRTRAWWAASLLECGDTADSGRKMANAAAKTARELGMSHLAERCRGHARST